MLNGRNTQFFGSKARSKQICTQKMSQPAPFALEDVLKTNGLDDYRRSVLNQVRHDDFEHVLRNTDAPKFAKLKTRMQTHQIDEKSLVAKLARLKVRLSHRPRPPMESEDFPCPELVDVVTSRDLEVPERPMNFDVDLSAAISCLGENKALVNLPESIRTHEEVSLFLEQIDVENREWLMQQQQASANQFR